MYLISVIIQVMISSDEPFDPKIPSELVDHEGDSLFLLQEARSFCSSSLNLLQWLSNFTAQAAIDPMYCH